MPTAPDRDLLAALARLGVATSAQLQQALSRSQPTLSRALEAAAGSVVKLGQGRSTQYSLSRAILGAPARQPLFWVGADGQRRRWGTLSFLHGDRVHVAGGGEQWLGAGALPWMLAPLRHEGFLGRLLARRLAPFGFGGDPASWTVEQQLFAALQAPDGPGALVLGEATEPAADTADESAYDRLADAVLAQGHAGSSAGGEQPKFLARRPDGQAVVVKFSPPRGTPFGEAWHDLLHAEALALTVLHEHGVPVALPRLVHSARRTYLESPRFDRIGVAGRAHVVPLWAAHDAFVGGARWNWGATCEALAAQRRLPREAAEQARALLGFGQLIGNSDMHFGNLSLAVQPQDVARGRFTLAPLYDMLPMRWRPDAASGELGLLPFTPEPAALASPAAVPARRFWGRMAQDGEVSAAFGQLAEQMARRLRAP